MNYLELAKTLKSNNLYLFSLRDIENLFPQDKIKTLKNNLGRWTALGYFYRLKRDLYEFVEPGTKSTIPDLYISNRLYFPSYVSLETALSIYNIIPEVAAQVTAITTRPTRVFRNKHGIFLYHSCQKKAFLGYRLISYEGFKVLIADRERSLVDFLYFRLRTAREINFRDERFDKDILKKLSWRKVLKYAMAFNKKTAKFAKDLKEFGEC